MIKTIAKITVVTGLLLSPITQVDRYEHAKEYNPIIEVEAVGISENIAVEPNGDLIYSENGITFERDTEYLVQFENDTMINIIEK